MKPRSRASMSFSSLFGSSTLVSSTLVSSTIESSTLRSSTLKSSTLRSSHRSHRVNSRRFSIGGFFEEEKEIAPLPKTGLDLCVFIRSQLVKFLLNGISRNYIERNKEELEKIVVLMQKYGEDLRTIWKIDMEFDQSREPLLESSHSCSDLSHHVKTTIETQPLMKSVESITVNFSQIKSRHFALELTRIYSSMMANMNVHEILYAAMSDDCSDPRCSTILSLITEFDKLAHFVPTYILMNCDQQQQRISAIKKFIRIAVELKKQRNFHGMFAIVAGLLDISITRIDSLWATKSRWFETYESLIALISPTKNYITYRNHLKSLKLFDQGSLRKSQLMQPGLSIIPYIGLFTRDIKMVMENPLITSSQINMDIYELQVNTAVFYDSMNKNYDIPENKPIYQFMTQLTTRTDDDLLYNKSLTILPLITIQKKSSTSNKAL